MKKEESARRLALDCLTQIQKETTIAQVIDQTLRRSRLSAADSRLLNELVYGTIRWRKQIDWVLKHYVNPRFQLEPRIRNLLRLGTYQLLHLDKIPPHAAIYETVELAKQTQKTARFVNAVLRSVQREASSLEYPSIEFNPAGHISLTQSYPQWLIERWLEQHGVEWTLAFCRASNQIAPLSIRVNTLKTDRQILMQSLIDAGASVKESDIIPDALLLLNSPPLQSLSAYREGQFYVQDESAMWVAPLLCPQPGETVVDLCASPGGKTTHIAQLMENSGEITAVDVSESKISRLRQNCQRLGVTNVQTRISNVATDNLRFIEHADTVLIDAPCSGFGTLRRHPDIRWNKDREQIRELARLQFRILRNVARYMKPGSVLVYSTCSTEPEENQGVIERFLQAQPHFVIENVGDVVTFLPESAITSEGFLQTFPHQHGIDGAFAARLRAEVL